MRAPLILIVLCLLGLSGLTQHHPGQYFIGFSDKDSSPYSLSTPADFLSQRAIDRREKQNILLDDHDLPVDPSYLQQLGNIPGIDLKYTLKWINGAVIWVGDSTQVPVISALPFVNQVEFISPKDFHTQKQERELRVAASTTGQSTELEYGQSYGQTAIMNLDVLHDAGYQGQGMLIAVIDGGFISADTMSAFKNLFSEGRVLATFDFVSPGAHVFRKSTHGTYVLSTMAGYLPGKYIGTAPAASYLLLRSENTASEYISEEFNWMAAAEFADSAGADIINSSLGYTNFDDTLMNHTYSDMDGNSAISTIAADMAASRGILVVNSAGNSGNSSWFFIGAPADGDSVLTVGAINVLGEYGSFSSKGPSSDGRVKPNVSTVGWQTAFVGLSGEIVYGNGTSFASPIMAGAAACLWQRFPTAGNMDILKAVENSADHFLDPDSLTGYGIPDLALASLILDGGELPVLDKDFDFKVIPNPFSDKVLIVFETSTAGLIDISVHDMSGRAVFTHSGYPIREGYNAFQLRGLDSLANGMYSIVLRDGEHLAVRKAFKSRH